MVAKCDQRLAWCGLNAGDERELACSREMAVRYDGVVNEDHATWCLAACFSPGEPFLPAREFPEGIRPNGAFLIYRGKFFAVKYQYATPNQFPPECPITKRNRSFGVDFSVIDQYYVELLRDAQLFPTR